MLPGNARKNGLALAPPPQGDPRRHAQPQAAQQAQQQCFQPDQAAQQQSPLQQATVKAAPPLQRAESDSRQLERPAPQVQLPSLCQLVSCSKGLEHCFKSASASRARAEGSRAQCAGSDACGLYAGMRCFNRCCMCAVSHHECFVLTYMHAPAAGPQCAALPWLLHPCCAARC